VGKDLPVSQHQSSPLIVVLRLFPDSTKDPYGYRFVEEAYFRKSGSKPGPATKKEEPDRLNMNR
jgi:hypothetical protein